MKQEQYKMGVTVQIAFLFKIQEFKKNLRRTNGNGDFKASMLEEVYHAIRYYYRVLASNSTMCSLFHQSKIMQSIKTKLSLSVLVYNKILLQNNQTAASRVRQHVPSRVFMLILIRNFFLDNPSKGEKLQWGYPYVKQQTRTTRSGHITGNYDHYSLRKVCGFFNVPSQDNVKPVCFGRCVELKLNWWLKLHYNIQFHPCVLAVRARAPSVLIVNYGGNAVCRDRLSTQHLKPLAS